MKRFSMLYFFLFFLLSCYDGLNDMYNDLGLKVPICVNLSAASGGDGRGWGMAYNNLNTAIAAANAGDEIWVANPSGADSTGVVIDKSVALYGGFNGTERRKDERDLSNKTVISGISGTNAINIMASGVVIDGFEIKNTINGNGIYISGGGYSASICNTDFNNNANTNSRAAISINSATVEISKCSFVSNSTNSNGAAIKSQNIETDNTVITIKDSIFKKNTATSSTSNGGACYFNYVDILEISDCTFGVNGSPADANTAGYGGALYVVDTNAVISDSFFYNNECNPYHGGAIFNTGTTAGNLLINNCILSGNISSNFAGAIYSGYNMTISNSNITNNQGESGGGIYIYSGSCVITGSNIINNTATLIGGGIRLFNGPTLSSLSVSDSSFISNTAASSNGGGIASAPAGNIHMVIQSCRFESNIAGDRGGAISFLSSNTASYIINSVFYNNSSSTYGGALYLVSSGNPSLTNLTFYSNQTLTSGGAIYGTFYPYTINNSVFYSNTKTSGGTATDNVFISGGSLVFNHSFSYGGLSAFTDDNSITTNPDVPFVSTNNTSVSFLQPADCIVNYGDNDAAGLDLINTDLAGNNRKNGTVDIGAYERQ